VWLERRDGEWKTVSLILITDTTLNAELVIENYCPHWPIKPIFNRLKQIWVIKET
jgi:hypothetical protein